MLLLENGNDINSIEDEYNNTCTHLCLFDHPDRLKLYLKYKPDLTIKNTFDRNIKQEISYLMTCKDGFDQTHRENVIECSKILEKCDLIYRSPFPSIIDFESTSFENGNWDTGSLFITYYRFSWVKINPKIGIPDDFKVDAVFFNKYKPFEIIIEEFCGRKVFVDVNKFISQ